MPREETAFAQEASAPLEAEISEDDEAEDDEAGEQASQARSDQAGGGERRPRRRGRRGGRRRRGGPDEGLAGSINDELSPLQASEVTSAVADFDGGPSEPSHVAAERTEAQPAVVHEPVSPLAEAEAHAPESDKSARRRSTVREKVSFASQAPSEPSAAAHSESQPSSPAEAPADAAGETAADTAPRRAGWWSRRFGGG
jgi:ribonuclease E